MDLKVIKTNFEKAKSLKTSLDVLGYVFVNGKKVTDKSCYRKYLRSGKIEGIKQYSDNREFQTNRFYNSYFISNQGITINPSYKLLIRSFVINENSSRYFKFSTKVSKNLLKLGYFEVYNLGRNTLIKDNFNKVDFYFCHTTRKLSRLINNKVLPYNTK